MISLPHAQFTGRSRPVFRKFRRKFALLPNDVKLGAMRDYRIGQYKMQTADCRLQIGFKMQTRYKMLTADCRLSLKCRLRPKLSHRLIRDIFSIYDFRLISLRDPNVGLVISFAKIFY